MCFYSRYVVLVFFQYFQMNLYNINLFLRFELYKRNTYSVSPRHRRWQTAPIVYCNSHEYCYLLQYKHIRHPDKTCTDVVYYILIDDG